MKVLNYTRLPLEDAVYAKRLAYSMHLALENEDGSFMALNHNSGVLFVKATENEDGSLNPKSLKNPWLFSMKEGGFGVFAVRTLANGEDDTEDLGTAVFWTSSDLVRYEQQGLVKLADGVLRDVRCAYDESEGVYELFWQQADGKWKKACWSSKQELFLNDPARKLNGIPLDIKSAEMTAELAQHASKQAGDLAETAPKQAGNVAETAPKQAGNLAENDSAQAGNLLQNGDSAINTPAFSERIAGIQGAVPRNVVEISEGLGEYLKKKLMPAEMVGAKVPGEVRLCLNADKSVLAQVKAEVLYSDGAKLARKIVWDTKDLEKIDSRKPGNYSLHGKVYRPHFAFPICTDRADPCVCRWNGKYYFIATNDADNNHTLYMRCAESLEGIADAEEHLILDSSTYEDVKGLLWASEFHEIDGRLYLFHACTPGPFFCEESHVMELREGGDPLRKEDWSRPRRVVRRDGSELCEQGKEITLDMTEFEWQGELYAIWSQRQFLPKDLGAWLYIAKLNREKPWMLASDPVVLSKPEFGWANNHTFVDEGPFALIRGDRLFVTFSSAAVDSTYVVGLLQIEAGKELLVKENWLKTGYPLFSSRSYAGEYGTGHNAYVIDEDGIIWNTYHARPGIDGPRSSGIRRVHFDIDGEPMLDVTEELDLKEELCSVETVVVVENTDE